MIGAPYYHNTLTTIVLPSYCHDNFLPLIHTVINPVMDSMPLNHLWDITFSTHMSRKILLLETTAIPDLLLEMDGPGENIPLWIIKVNFSEPE